MSLRDERRLWRRAMIDTGYGESATGLDRTLGTAPWVVPPDIGLNATGELLVWRWGAPAERRQLPGHGLLDDFVRLADAEPERILVYARHWGVFWLPRRHMRLDRRPERLLAQEEAWRQQEAREWASEPLTLWRSYSRQARAILTIAAVLANGRPEEEEALWEESWAVLEAAGGWPATDPHAALAQAIDDWLKLGDVRPRVRYIDGAPRLRLRPSGLLGALGLALSAAISRAQGVDICRGCSQPYTPERKPVATRRNYCPACRAAKVPLRDAKRDQRARNRAVASETGV